MKVWSSIAFLIKKAEFLRPPPTMFVVQLNKTFIFNVLTILRKGTIYAE
jgi:hypothetical protein